MFYTTVLNRSLVKALKSGEATPGLKPSLKVGRNGLDWTDGIHVNKIEEHTELFRVLHLSVNKRNSLCSNVLNYFVLGLIVWNVQVTDCVIGIL